MKAFRTLLLASLACLTACLAPLVQADTPIPGSLQYSNRLQFRIPFKVTAGSAAEQGAQQFRLYVSRDQGKSWQQGESVPPSAGKFAFKAPSDGEYWFIVRTVDAQGRVHPDLKMTTPGMKVVVDTVPPALELKLQQVSPGTVRLDWEASDEHLDATQLRFQYRQSGVNEWQDLSIIPKATGNTTWKLPQGGIVSVKGMVPDQASNVTTKQVDRRIQPGNQAVPPLGAPHSRQPVAGSDPEKGDPLAMSMPERFPGVGLAPIDEEDHELDPTTDRHGHGVRPQAAVGSGGGAKGNFVSHRTEDRLASATDSVPARGPSDIPRTGHPGRRRVVDSRKFQIGYNIENVGPSGIGKVELYITDDNGTTWYHYGSDDDNVSPIIVEVPREGTYGFALGVRSGAGLASDPPQNGDAPAIVVVVDQTAPTVELLPIQQGTGKNVNKLLITWKCSDDNLTERPISLSYSATGKGPWELIVGPIENSESYVWSIPAGLPAKIFLRIEARDLAGHVRTVETPQPVILDLTRPTAKIIDIETPHPAAVPR